MCRKQMAKQMMAVKTDIWRMVLLVAVAVTALAGCDKAPNGVIKESTMVDLMADLDKADAYVSMHPDEFDNDTVKNAFKQSVMAKYGVTIADYDRSMGWYAANVEKLVKVQDKVLRKLESESKKIEKAAKKEAEAGMNSHESNRLAASGSLHKMYPNHGDSADVWEGDRRWVLSPNMGRGYVTFDFEPDKDSRAGDRYKLDYRLMAFNNKFKVLLAVDYVDGSTSLVSRASGFDNWESVTLQCDSSKTVRRVYGYFRYDMNAVALAFVDSVSLLRTHLDTNGYVMKLKSQKFVERNFDSAAKRSAPVVEDEFENAFDDRRRR